MGEHAEADLPGNQGDIQGNADCERAAEGRWRVMVVVVTVSVIMGVCH